MQFLRRFSDYLTDPQYTLAEKREFITRQYALGNAIGAGVMAVFFALDKWEPLVGAPIFLCIMLMLVPVFWPKKSSHYLLAQLIFFAAMYFVIALSAAYLGKESDVHLFAILLFIMLLLLVGFEKIALSITALAVTIAILAFPLYLPRPEFLPPPPAQNVIATTRTVMDVLFFLMLTAGFGLFAALLSAETRALKFAIAEKEELARMLAHDIQNPANAALQYARLAQKNPANLVGVLTQLERLRTTISNILAFVAEKIRLEPKAFADLHFSQIKEYVNEQFNPIAEAKNIRLVFTAPAQWKFTVEPQSFFNHVLGNLIGNALRHAPTASALVLRGDEQGDAYLLCIEDEGPGISPAALERKERSAHGHGISIAQKFAALNHLEITWFSCQLGNHNQKGTRVELRQKKNTAR